MPIYEYRCLRCSNEFEKLVLSPGKKPVCPACESEDVTRKFSVFGMKTSTGFVSSAAGKDCQSCRSSNCETCH